MKGDDSVILWFSMGAMYNCWFSFDLNVFAAAEHMGHVVHVETPTTKINKIKNAFSKFPHLEEAPKKPKCDLKLERCNRDKQGLTYSERILGFYIEQF